METDTITITITNIISIDVIRYAASCVFVVLIIVIAQRTREVIGGGQIIVQSAATVLYRVWDAVHDMARGVW